MRKAATGDPGISQPLKKGRGGGGVGLLDFSWNLLAVEQVCRKLVKFPL